MWVLSLEFFYKGVLLGLNWVFFYNKSLIYKNSILINRCVNGNINFMFGVYSKIFFNFWEGLLAGFDFPVQYLIIKLKGIRNISYCV